MAVTVKWYALYTKPRFEKKVFRQLGEKGFEAYCPLNKVKRQWSDRVKTVEEPLFKSYVFVRLSTELERSTVRTVPGVVNFVYWNGQPAEVKEKEIEDIQRFLSEYDNVELVPFEFRENARVVIRSGVMMDKEATVQRVLNKHVEVLVESLGYKLIAHIEKTNLIPKSS